MVRMIFPLILLVLMLSACAKSMSTGPNPGSATPARATTGASSGAPVLGTAAAGAAAGAGGGLSVNSSGNTANKPIWEK